MEIEEEEKKDEEKEEEEEEKKGVEGGGGEEGWRKLMGGIRKEKTLKINGKNNAKYILVF